MACPEQLIRNYAFEYVKANLFNDKKLVSNMKKEIIQTYIDIININSHVITPLLVKDLELASENIKLNDGGYIIAIKATATYRVRPGSSEYLLPLEWGLNLHPVYCFPYIPGSSVKGALRSTLYLHFYEWLIANKHFNEDKAKEKAEELAEIFFGSSDDYRAFMSRVVAFDAIPIEPGVGKNYVVGDVLTPIYAEAKDELSTKPKPIIGLSIAEGTKFYFVLKVNAGEIWEEIKDNVLFKEYLGLENKNDNEAPEYIAKFVAALMLKVFREVGLGGKTTRGYGYFTPISIKMRSGDTNER